MRFSTIASIALPLTFALAACSSDSNTNDGGPGTDATSGPDGSGADATVNPDADPPDTGPQHCLHDQGGEANRGCEPGFVCNLAMDPPACVAGKTCASDTDCNSCSDFTRPEDCGHGFNVVAVCDTRHGNVCTRSRAPCETCEEDRDCGRPHPILPVTTPNRCLDYGAGAKFCGRACGTCPKGFICDSVEGQCKAASCDTNTLICDPDNMTGPTCTGTDQICPGEVCSANPELKCSTNDQPGALGICIDYCTQNSDCPANLPVCNLQNGLCIAGCTQGSCAANQVCHLDGMCRAPCPDDADCQMRFGQNTYCNVPGNPPPRLYKGYRDQNSCAPLGCEDKVDCVVAGRVCDKTLAIPECVAGCFESDDCTPGFICKSTGGQPPRDTYSRQECRALPIKNNMDELGVCCNPGCTDRILQCGINEFCCGEVGSPYEDPASCLTVTSTGGRRAEAGECFDMGMNPWCAQCGSDGDCNSGYTPGYNTDPNINGGQPFQEQEWCVGLPPDGSTAICNVTCNPNNIDDNQCPRGWNCEARTAPCLQDADCNGLPCIGADTTTMPPRPGQCKCGEANTPTAACPTAYAQLPSAALNPRCVDVNNTGGNMYCVVSYNCEPPLQISTYPAGCGF